MGRPDMRQLGLSTTVLYVISGLFTSSKGAIFGSCDKKCAVGGQCPTYHHGENCYQFVATEVYWKDAEKRCKKIGGTQVAIYNQRTMDFIIDVLNRKLRWTKNGVWNGANDFNEGRWAWSRLGTPFSYTNWASGNPSPILGSLKDCGVMRRSKNWQWEDTFCRVIGFQYRFICQYFPEKNTEGENTGLSVKEKALMGFLIGGGILLVIVVVACSVQTYMRKSSSFSNRDENALNVYYESNAGSNPAISKGAYTSVPPPPPYESVCGTGSGDLGGATGGRGDNEIHKKCDTTPDVVELKNKTLEEDPEMLHVDLDQYQARKLGEGQSGEGQSGEGQSDKCQGQSNQNELGATSKDLSNFNNENGAVKNKLYPDIKMVPNILVAGAGNTDNEADTDSLDDGNEDKVLNVEKASPPTEKLLSHVDKDSRS